jgi:hypothetical protein
LLETSFVQKQFCSKTVLFENSFVRKQFCSKTVLVENSFVRKQFCPKIVLVKNSFAQNQFCSKSVLFKISFVQKQFCSKTVLVENSFVRKHAQTQLAKKEETLARDSKSFSEGFFQMQRSLAAVCHVLEPYSENGRKSSVTQGCQIFLGPNLPKRSKYTNGPQTTPNGHALCIPNIHKLYQMAVKYCKIFHFMAIKNIHKLGFLVLQ